MFFLLSLNGEKLKSTKLYTPQVIANNIQNNPVTTGMVWMQYLPLILCLLFSNLYSKCPNKSFLLNLSFLIINVTMRYNLMTNLSYDTFFHKQTVN